MLEVRIKILGVLICTITNLGRYVVGPGVNNLTIFLLIRLRIEMKVNIVFSMKAKTHTLNAFPKVKLFTKLRVYWGSQRWWNQRDSQNLRDAESLQNTL